MKTDWKEIKRRYLSGEPPRDIAPDYGLSAKQVSDRANRSGWSKDRKTIDEKIAEKVVEKEAGSLAAIRTQTLDVISSALATLAQHFKDDPNPLLFDGEGRVNPLYTKALEIAGKIATASTNTDDPTQIPLTVKIVGLNDAAL